MTLLWLFVSLPSMPAKTERSGTVFRVLRSQNVPLGMAAVSRLLEYSSPRQTKVLSLVGEVEAGARFHQRARRPTKKERPEPALQVGRYCGHQGRST